MINIDKIKNDAQFFCEQSKGSHDWEHTLRVYNLALHIGEKEGADMDVIKVSSLLHDMARHEQDLSKGLVCHAERGSILAKEYLEKDSYPADFIEKVISAIGSHRFKKRNPPNSLEAKILYDADKLDGIGAVGIGRAFLFAGEHHAKMHNPIPDIRPEAEYTNEDTAYREYVTKLSKIKDLLFTDEAKKIASSRHAFMEAFFIRLNSEYEGIL